MCYAEYGRCQPSHQQLWPFEPKSCIAEGYEPWKPWSKAGRLPSSRQNAQSYYFSFSMARETSYGNRHRSVEDVAHDGIIGLR